VKPPEGDWCNIQFPVEPVTLTTGGKVTVFGQAYVAGVTDPEGKAADIVGEIGIGAKGTNGSTDPDSWDWAVAP